MVKCINVSQKRQLRNNKRPETVTFVCFYTADDLTLGYSFKLTNYLTYLSKSVFRLDGLEISDLFKRSLVTISQMKMAPNWPKVFLPLCRWSLGPFWNCSFAKRQIWSLTHLLTFQLDWLEKSIVIKSALRGLRGFAKTCLDFCSRDWSTSKIIKVVAFWQIWAYYACFVSSCTAKHN